MKKSLIPPTKTQFFFARLRRATFFSKFVFFLRAFGMQFPLYIRVISIFFSRAFGARFPPLFTTLPCLQMYTFNETFTKTTERDLQKIYKFYKNHQSCQELQNFTNFTKTTRRDLQKKYKIYKNSSP